MIMTFVTVYSEIKLDSAAHSYSQYHNSLSSHCHHHALWYVNVSSPVLFPHCQEERNDNEAADREDITEPGRAYARDVEDAEEDDSDDVVPDVQPASDHSLRDGIQFLNTKLHQQRRGGDDEAVAGEDARVDTPLECGHGAEPDQLQWDKSQQCEH